jgi:signal transduction histidine kinase
LVVRVSNCHDAANEREETDPPMTSSTARRLAHSLWIAAFGLWITALAQSLIDEPQEAVLVVLLGLPTATYATVGALVARRRPDNPIGWLFCAAALGLGLWMFANAYAQSGLGEHPVGLGSLPGAAVAAWVGVLSAVILPVVLPTFLLYFPDGHLRSRRWRVAIAFVVIGGMLIFIGAMAEASQNSGSIHLVPPTWVTRIPGAGGFFPAGLAFAVAAAFAGLLALSLRFRSATAQERQSLRLLVGMITAMAVATGIAIVSALASQGADWSWIPAVLAILVDGFGVLIGIPLAAAAAVLTYGLYDVGIVMKKTVVYVVLVVFFLLLLGLVSLMLTSLGFIGADGDGSGGRELIVARIATAVSVSALVLIVAFRPVKGLARRLVFGRRATPYEAMAKFSERLGETYSTDDVLPRMAEIVRASTGADVARVWLHVGTELRPAASAPSTAPPASLIGSIGDEIPETDGIRTFPVRDRGELLGALTVAMPAAEPLRKGGEKLVTDLASQAGLVLRNVRLIEELQESRRRIVTAQDERARKLERDLHDGAQQQLVAVSVKLGLVEKLTTRDPEKARAILAELKEDAADALDNLRDLARGIYPPLLADKGLEAALEAQARKSQLDVRVDADGCGRYPQEVEAAVYFCSLEALQNVSKYAKARATTITLVETNGDLSFRVRDDGVGFDPSATRMGAGLTNMRDRLEALGGALEIASMPGEGTTVAGRVPLARTG